jgi:hypothetical protein
MQELELFSRKRVRHRISAFLHWLISKTLHPEGLVVCVHAKNPVEFKGKEEGITMKLSEYVLVFVLVLSVAVPAFSGQKKKRITVSDQFELTQPQHLQF